LLASGKCGVAYYGSSTAGCEYETILTTLYENGVVWLSWLSVETKANWMDHKIRLYNDGTEQAWFGCNVDNPGTLHYYGGFWNWVANTRGDRVQGSNTFVAAATSPATPHLMVMKLDYVNGIAGYYIDPDPGVADPTASAVWYDEAAIDSAAAMPFNRMRLRRANWASTLTYFDEVRVGDTYGDVTPVPEPATLAVVLGALGFAAVRRR
jgi:hypothetical protein